MNWNYIAGFFDGEGNLHVHPVVGASGKKTYQLQVRIYSSDDKILKILQEFMNLGKIYLKKKTRVFELTIANKKDCFEFLIKIKDFVILKKSQINYLLNNYSFERENNLKFDLDAFRSFITRKNVKRIHHTIPYSEAS